MSDGACKVIIDGGNYNGSARHSADAAQVFVQLFLEAEPFLDAKAVKRAVEFSQKLCDWHELQQRWLKEIEAAQKAIHNAASSTDYVVQANRDNDDG